MARRLALFFDGTWNKLYGGLQEAKNTNVGILCTAARQCEGDAQSVYYETGVGSADWNALVGGVLGAGMDRKILEGYEFLVRNYKDGDEVFVFGFSRGAYSARSLVGLIGRVGLITKVNVNVHEEAQAFERLVDAQSPRAEGAHWAMFNRAYAIYRDRSGTPAARDAYAAEFREKYSRPMGIKCVGVWDTVGSRGIPNDSFEQFNHAVHGFHDVKLGTIVDHAFHALALDERRAAFEPALWSAPARATQHVEQVWFLGDHSDVGGGHEDSPVGARLADIPLAWMAERARELGLELKLPPLRSEEEIVAQARRHDTYSEFLEGKYRKLHPPAPRRPGDPAFCAQSVHPSVTARWRAEGGRYRPAEQDLNVVLAAFGQPPLVA
jgi:uncharacterized protein (DUF2235 family)